MAKTTFMTVALDSQDSPSVFVLDINKLCYMSFKPETKEQTAKLVLDFGASQKMFEKKEAEQLYQELVRHPALSKTGNT